MRTAFFFAFSFQVIACGGASIDPSTTDHSAPGSPTAPSASPTTPGGSLVISDDTTLALRTKGGFSANGADVSACTIGVTEQTYTFVVATRQLDWTECTADANFTKNTLVTGSKSLSAAEAAPLAKALAALRIIEAPAPCGSDVSVELDVASPAALKPEIFYPPYNHCSESQALHLSGLDDLAYEMGKLAR